jgi:hypothetical protein
LQYQVMDAVGVRAAGWATGLAEGRRAYRRNWYRELGSRFGDHPVTALAEQRVKRGSGAVRWRSMLGLNRRLAEQLPAELREDWLTLEELLHAHWLAMAAVHYNLGVEDGLRQGVLEAAIPDGIALHDRIRALAAALSKAVSKL